MLQSIKNVMTNEDGATLVEYGMLVALVAAVSIAIVTTLGKQINTAFTSISSKM
jgi:pilus assembly protein Flp/PilA